MLNLITVNLLAIFRDRVFHGILAIAAVFLLIPSVSSLSMRQVTELSITLSLSLLSVILLLLSVSLGATTLWKDIERRYTYSVLSLPMGRSSYLIGKFMAVSIFILLAALVLGAVACVVVVFSSGIYPSERPVLWTNLVVCIIFAALKYIILVSYAFLFSTISTSFFLPVFGTIAVFMAGNASQQAYDFIHSPAANSLSPLIKDAASFFYYILPNFSAFDLQVNAIYGIALSGRAVFLPIIYFCIYTPLLIAAAAVIFARREMK
jgi:ABC-type transport system involved in multi-copper enzyme maturation permease subunit